MLGRLRSRLTYANVVATIAVFIATGGGAVAATGVLVKSSKQVARGAIRSSDLANHKAVKVKDLTRGARAALAGKAGPPGVAGSQGPQGPAGSDAQFDGAAAGGDLSGTYPNPSIGAGRVTTAAFAPSAKAPDADLLDGLDSATIARSNVFFGSAGPSTFTVPPGVTAVVVEARGAGGGGNFFDFAGSGGQGGFVRAWVPVTAGDALAVSVGAGGSHGSAAPGQPGGASSVARGGTQLVSAGGGGGGGSSGGTGGDATVSVPAVGIEKSKGADGSASSNAPGGGPADYFGSGDDAGGGFTTGLRGAGGYILLHLIRQ